MWKVFPKIGLLKVLFSIFSALFLSGLIFVLVATPSGSLGWSSFGPVFELAAPVTLLFIGIIYAIGKWGWLFVWKAPYLGKIMHSSVCPNLNGNWLGQIQSSFKNDDGNNITKDVELTIKDDLFGLHVNLRSADGYQDSKVIQSELYKDPRTNNFYLSYIFEANVPIPEETDDRVFDGAAKLEIIVGSDHTEMKGTYWTNRAWQRGKNTAGVLTVTITNS